MRIFYTNKVVFWSNQGCDYLEKNKFDEYLNDWVELPNIKSINWQDHYSANFYASDKFEATYFKIEKGNRNYYFFIEDIQFDSNKGRQFYLTLDLYNTYTIEIVEKLKTENPLVLFKRKHAERWSASGYIDISNKHGYYNNIPPELLEYEKFLLPTKNNKYNAEGGGKYTIDIATNINFVGEEKDKPGQLVATPRTKRLFVDIDRSKFLNNGRYRYLIVKKPPSTPVLAVNQFKDYNQPTTSDVWIDIKSKIKYEDNVLFIPIGHDNGYQEPGVMQNMPADYVVGLITSFIPPDKIGIPEYVANLYVEQWKDKVPFMWFRAHKTIPAFDNVAGALAFYPHPAPKNNYTFYFNNDYYFEGTYIQQYNIDNINAEPLLFMSPFYKKIINNATPVVSNYYLNNTYVGTKTQISLYTTFNTMILSRVNVGNSLNANEYIPPLFNDYSAKLPFSGDSYNNYINNNINSINTGLAVGRAKSTINAISSIASGAIGVGANIGYSDLANKNILAARENGRSMFDTGFWGQYTQVGATAGIFGGVTNAIFAGGQMITDMVSDYLKVKAAKADAANKPDVLLDTYGDGQSKEDDAFFKITTYSLPENVRRFIFGNIYFSGYLVNSFFKFNEYNNRQYFNYFELLNTHAIVSQYSKFPKLIIRDCATQLEKGIRLWKTSNFDYTMKLDNREVR